MLDKVLLLVTQAAKVSNANDTTAIGFKALVASQAQQNTGVGSQSLLTNSSGMNNTAVGYFSGKNNVGGSQNTFVGANTLVTSGQTYANSTAIGYGTEITTSNAIFLGTSSETSVFMGDMLLLTETSRLEVLWKLNNNKTQVLLI